MLLKAVPFTLSVEKIADLKKFANMLQAEDLSVSE